MLGYVVSVERVVADSYAFSDGGVAVKVKKLVAKTYAEACQVVSESAA